MEPFIPEFEGNLRKHMLKVPDTIRKASGIKIFGKLLKSFVFTTDVSVIRNVNADAVIAVYPFTPQPIITQAIMLSADIPVFCGIGGGITMGKRVINNALNAEFQGAMGVVVNAPTPDDVIAQLCEIIDLPVVVTVVSDGDISRRVEAGASIINVSGGPHTAQIVASIRAQYPRLPIIATGGPTHESIAETIAAGANAITWTPPSSADILADIMHRYRMHPHDLKGKQLGD